MDELIRKQDVINEIGEWIVASKYNKHEQSVADLRLVRDSIKELPPIQPKHGKWIDMPYVPSHTKYMCSECGKTIYTNSDYIKEHKFCFSCGAKMER